MTSLQNKFRLSLERHGVKHAQQTAWAMTADAVQAMLLMAPDCDGYKLDSDEERNIALGLEQLRELWISSDLPFDATIAAVEDFDEDIFRTRGEAKKSIRELSDMRNDARREIDEARQTQKCG